MTFSHIFILYFADKGLQFDITFQQSKLSNMAKFKELSQTEMQYIMNEKYHMNKCLDYILDKSVYLSVFILL